MEKLWENKKPKPCVPEVQCHGPMWFASQENRTQIDSICTPLHRESHPVRIDRNSALQSVRPDFPAHWAWSSRMWTLHYRSGSEFCATLEFLPVETRWESLITSLQGPNLVLLIRQQLHLDKWINRTIARVPRRQIGTPENDQTEGSLLVAIFQFKVQLSQCTFLGILRTQFRFVQILHWTQHLL